MGDTNKFFEKSAESFLLTHDVVLFSGIKKYERDKDIRAEQQRARNLENAQRAHQARKSRREQIREARIKQAQIENVAASAGQQESSAAIAAGSSLQARLGTNIGSIQQALAFSGAKSQSEQKILDLGRKGGAEFAVDTGINIFGQVAPLIAGA